MPETSSDTQFFSRRVLVAGAIISALAVLVYILRHLTQLLLIVFAGVLLGILLDGLAKRLAAHLPLSRGLALALIVIVAFGGTVGAGWLAGPSITNQVSQLSHRIPAAIEQIKVILEKHDWGKWIVENIPPAREILPFGRRQLVSVPDAFSSIVGVITGMLLVFFVGIYLAATPAVYLDNGLRLLPKSKRERAREVLHGVTHALQRWMVGRLMTMLVVGVLAAIGLRLIHLPLAFLLALIAAILAFVPFIGPTVATIPALLVGLAESPLMMVYVLFVFIIVETLEGYIITPMIQKRAVSIPPALLISFQIFMGALFGAVGLFLATPTAVAVIVVIQLLYVEDILGEKVTILGNR